MELQRQKKGFIESQKFFSGFGFTNEIELFEKFIDSSSCSIAGFSYGAIKAIKYANINPKISRLQLFSPSYFWDRDEKFKKLQLNSYKKNSDNYMREFYKNCGTNKYMTETSYQELEELLYYKWDKIFLLSLDLVEIYLGNCDKIIDINSAIKFFDFADIYILNNKGHTLL
jgi:hypothetical protein